MNSEGGNFCRFSGGGTLPSLATGRMDYPTASSTYIRWKSMRIYPEPAKRLGGAQARQKRYAATTKMATKPAGLP
jgi:hypothetical protein